MIGLATNENTTSPLQDGEGLIQEARLARTKGGSPTRLLEDQIERTRAASDAAADLARLINSLYAGPDDCAALA